MSKSLRVLALSWLLLLLPAFLLLSQAEAPSAGQPPQSPALVYQLLANPSVETYDPPYGQFEGVNCQVATGWQRFWYGGPEPGWMDTRVFADSHLGGGWVERIDGETSQLLVATEPYSAGIYQQVTGLTPGVGYGFHAAMLTIFQTSAQDPIHNTMIKDVGMDPTGGTDPLAPTVIWSEPDAHDQGPWAVDIRTAVYAQVPTMTVFVRVRSPYPSGDPSLLNLSFLDSAILAETAVITASSPAASDDLTFLVRWDDFHPSAGGQIRWFDVQWLDEAEGVWHDWFSQTTDLQASFSGERGHTYRFRARAWQRYPNGAHLYGPYRADGDTRTYVTGPRLVGQVLSHEGHPIPAAMVAISGTAYSVESGLAGLYQMDLESLAGPQTVTVSHSHWLPPAPVYSVTFGLTETVALTWTLRPPDDPVINSGFEAGLDGWSVTSEQGETPMVVDSPVHTGWGAMSLGSDAAVSLTVGVSQTVRVTNAWEPALSFWYLPVTDDADDRFNVVVTVVSQTVESAQPATTTRVFTPSLDVGDWTHQWYYPGPPDRWLTGTLTIDLRVWHDGDVTTTTVYLDEVSVGATLGGPYKNYVPLVFKVFK